MTNRFHLGLRIFFGLLLAAAFITGCDFGPKLAPTPTPTEALNCGSQGKYYSDASGILGNQFQLASAVAVEIYNRSLEARAAQNEGKLSIEKNKALQFLAYETQLWSHIQNMRVGENGKLRLVMTFVSPELVYAVLLNHVIYGNLPLSENDLNRYVQGVLNGLDERHEYMVLVSIQTELPDQAPITIDLSGDKIVLKPGDNAVVPSHYDSAFNQPFEMSTGQRTGLFYFPFKVKHKKQECRDVIDMQHDQVIPLAISGARINDQELPQLDFMIPFVNPLGVVKIVPTPNPGVLFQPESYKPVFGLPAIQDVGATGTVTGLTLENLGYWQAMGRFVWATLTSGYFLTP